MGVGGGGSLEQYTLNGHKPDNHAQTKSHIYKEPKRKNRSSHAPPRSHLVNYDNEREDLINNDLV